MEYRFVVYGPDYPDWAIAGFQLVDGDRHEVEIPESIRDRFAPGYFDAHFAPIINRGADQAIAARTDFPEPLPGHLLLDRFEIWDAGTKEAGIECASSAAAWLTLGQMEDEMTIVIENGEWHAVFKNRMAIIAEYNYVRTWSGGKYLEVRARKRG